MSVNYILQTVAFIALLGFSLYMAQQNEDDHLRKRWKNIIAIIALFYLAGTVMEEFNLFPG